MPMNGKRLKELREFQVFSQNDLAKKAGLNVRTVRALENDYYPTAQPKTIRALAEALGVDARELLGETHE